MSYLFDASGEYLEGTLATTRAVDGSNSITIAAWAKITNWSGSQRGIVTLEEVSDTADPSIRLWSNVTDAVFAGAYDSGSLSHARYDFSVADEYDGVWVLVVGVYTSNVLRDIYIEDSTNTGTDTGNRTLDAGDVVRIGNLTHANVQAGGYVAEVCIWNTALSTSDIDALQTAAETGPPPNTVVPGNVIGYWPMDADNATQSNEGSDASGDLTVTNATYSSDHPTIITDVPVNVRRHIGFYHG